MNKKVIFFLVIASLILFGSASFAECTDGQIPCTCNGAKSCVDSVQECWDSCLTFEFKFEQANSTSSPNTELQPDPLQTIFELFEDSPSHVSDSVLTDSTCS